MTFPLTSTPSLSFRNVSLHRHDSSLLNFDLNTAIDDGDDVDDDEVVEEVVEGEEEEEEILVLLLSVTDTDSNGFISTDDGVGISVIEYFGLIHASLSFKFSVLRERFRIRLTRKWQFSPF